ncbi:hypothetical protein KHQ81_06625 [Mycoplasmatota bacterium]|nr:hypothetical protein KHQ81_06625 [Mycoplasmatota bacterium]
MKVIVNENYETFVEEVLNYYSYNIIHKEKINENTIFIVVAKYFFRCNGIASLSMVITNMETHCVTSIVGSSGVYGVTKSFEKSLFKLLNYHDITYEIL